ncbi:MAG: hypothetical protein ACFFFK_00670 [Candidatus Thorarchaeota archaeon]
MAVDNSKPIVVATIIIVSVFTAAYLSMSNFSNPFITPNSSGIASLTICGNSSDLIYPELAEAYFVYIGNNTWLINANFVDDSYSYEQPEIYDRNFTITLEELKSIDNALHEGMNQTYSSNLTALVLLEPCPNIWYSVDIVYTDGSWISLTAFQTEPGYIIYNHGLGDFNPNLLNGDVLEPMSALDCFVLAIQAIFSNHLG